MRGDQNIRQWKIMRYLANSRQPKTVLEIIVHIKMGCSNRTVYRDLEVLQVAGFPLSTIETGKHNQKRWELLTEKMWEV